MSLLANEVAARRVCVEPGHGPLVELTWAVLLERARTHIPLHAAGTTRIGAQWSRKTRPRRCSGERGWEGSRDEGEEKTEMALWRLDCWIAGCFRVS